MNFIKLFTAHPTSVKMTYLTHCLGALKIGVKLLLAGVGVIIHGIFPFLCCETASKTVKELYYEFQCRELSTQKMENKS